MYLNKVFCLVKFFPADTVRIRTSKTLTQKRGLPPILLAPKNDVFFPPCPNPIFCLLQSLECKAGGASSEEEEGFLGQDSMQIRSRTAHTVLYQKQQQQRGIVCPTQKKRRKLWGCWRMCRHLWACACRISMGSLDTVQWNGGLQPLLERRRESSWNARQQSAVQIQLDLQIFPIENAFTFLIFSGIFFVLPCIESYQKVDLRTITLGVPPQEVCFCHLLGNY